LFCPITSPTFRVASISTVVPVTAAVATPAIYVFVWALPSRVVLDSLLIPGWPT
jgi:hypothetical protein